MRSDLEAATSFEEDLLVENQRIVTGYQYYHDLVFASLVACLISDAKGVIVEANRAIAQVLNVPQQYLYGKSLMVYVAEGDRSTFYSYLNQFPQIRRPQLWQINMRAQGGRTFAMEWYFATSHKVDGTLKSVQIGIYARGTLAQANPSIAVPSL